LASLKRHWLYNPSEALGAALRHFFKIKFGILRYVILD